MIEKLSLIIVFIVHLSDHRLTLPTTDSNLHARSSKDLVLDIILRRLLLVHNDVWSINVSDRRINL